MGHQAFQAPTDIKIEGGFWGSAHIIGLVLGVIGFALWAILGLNHNVEHAAYSFLFAWSFVFSIAIGALGFVIIQHIVRAGWSTTVRRMAENMAMTLPILGVAMVVFLFVFAHDVYPWTHEDHLDAILQKKTGYLNTKFLLLRACVYTVIWTLLSWKLRRNSLLQDERHEDEDLSLSSRFIASLGMPFYALTTTFAAFDWIMSLQPHWYSTIFGVYFFAGSMLGTYTFMVLVAKSLQRNGYVKDMFTIHHYHALGKFIFGHVVFWAYIGFSQFFLIWYANIPEETEFYLHRVHHGWAPLSWLLPVFHFFIPFLFLLSRHVKRHHGALIAASIYVMIAHALDLYWLIMPMAGQNHKVDGHVHYNHFGHGMATDLCALIGWFGIFFGLFALFQRSTNLVPIGDPRLEEAVRQEQF